MLRLGALFIVGLLLIFGLGCGVGRHVQKGINCYQVGDLPCAMSWWAELEVQQAEMNPKGQVRYLVYRGLTHYQLGERSQALLYLGQGEQAYLQGDPDWLAPQAAVQLRQAIEDLRQHGSEVAPSAPPEQPSDQPVTIQ